MTQLPDRPGGSPPPERRVTREQFELVIRRAAELQARAAEAQGEPEMTEEEVLRIGRELGLSRMHLGQALAEVGEPGPREEGLLTQWLGEARLAAARTVPGDAAEIGRALEAYLVHGEYMTVLRRFPDRTLFVEGSGVIAAVGRAANRLRGRNPPLQVSSLEVAVRPLEAGYAYVSLATSLSTQRAGLATGALLGGGGAGGALAVFLGIAVAPPVALLGLPVAGAFAYAVRPAYARMARRTQVQLESLLDRLEHGEIRAPASRRGPPPG